MDYSHESIHLKPGGTHVKNTPVSRSYWSIRVSTCFVTVCRSTNTVGEEQERIARFDFIGNDIILYLHTGHVDLSWNEILRYRRNTKE